MEFKHPLCQNNKQWKGYTVFKLDFNGSPVEFVTLVDAKHILQKEWNHRVSSKQSEAVEIAFLKQLCEYELPAKVNKLIANRIIQIQPSASAKEGEE